MASPVAGPSTRPYLSPCLQPESIPSAEPLLDLLASQARLSPSAVTSAESPPPSRSYAGPLSQSPSRVGSPAGLRANSPSRSRSNSSLPSQPPSRGPSPAAAPVESLPPSRSHSRPPSRPPSRARSNSVFSNVNEKRYDERIRKKRYESVQRLKSAWELLLEKYGHVRPEDDDEIDLVTGTVVKNRGRLEGLVPREFGQVSDGEEEEEEEDDSVFGQEPTYDTDEDELGQWDDRSGLDNQDEDEEEPPPPPPKRWTFEDQLDLEAFLKLEGRRIDDEGGGDEDEGVPSTSQRRHAPRTKGEAWDVPRLGAGDSDDELLAQTSDAEEATRIEFVPSDGQEGSSRGRQPNPKSTRQSLDSRASLQASHRSPATAARLGHLFTPPPDIAPIPRAAPVPIVKPIPQRSVFVFQERIFMSIPKVEKPKKVKPASRSTIDRPKEVAPPDLDPAAYHQNVMHSRNGISLRFCKACVAAEVERGDLAIWCKGRTSVLHCTFEPRPPSEDEESAVEEETGIFSGRFRSVFEKKDDKRAGRSCRRCRKAGGIRADRAVSCKGKKNRAMCPYDSDDTDVDLPRIPSPPRNEPIVRRAVLPDVNPKELDPERYLSDVHYTHGGARIRACAACRYSGGEREKRAAYCKGRWRIALCTFSVDDQGTDGEDNKVGLRIKEAGPAFDATNDPLDRIGSEDLITSITSHVLDARGDFTEMPQRYTRPSQLDIGISAPHGLDPKRYLDTVHVSPMSLGSVRRCKHCRQAGGERAALSQWCKGRARVKMCSWYVEGDDGDWAPEGGIEERQTAAIQPVASRLSTPTQPAKTIVNGLPPLEDGYYFDVRYSRNGKTLVRCQACVRSGGMRLEKAKWCKGRRHPGLCAYAKWDVDNPEKPAGNEDTTVEPADHQPHRSETPTPLSSRDHFEEVDDTIILQSGGSSKRRRNPAASLDEVYPTSEQAAISSVLRSQTQQDLLAVRDTEECIVAADLGDVTHRVDEVMYDVRVAEPEQDDQRHSSSVSSSLPPSSPPLPVEPLQSARHPSNPTPSPDIAAPIDHKVSDQSPSRLLIPTMAGSSPVPPTSLARKAPSTFRPTPPPSIGARSASFSSDLGTASQVRRGILRRPSDFDRTGSLPRLAKRTRFSLASLSPPRVTHSDPIQPLIDEDDDELLLGPSTSPVYPNGRLNTTVHARPFSREVSVRAKDIGFNLSAHTGRLSSDMLAALAPALGHPRPTSLGSSLRPGADITNEGTGTGYSLSTPPSFSLSLCRPKPTPLSQEILPTTIMLPPAISPSHARPPTPVSAEGEDESDGETVTPLNRLKRRAKSISASQFEKQRDRSSPMAIHPASTPRKKSRLEEEVHETVMLVEDEGTGWGLDEDVGEEGANLWREGSVVRYLD